MIWLTNEKEVQIYINRGAEVIRDYELYTHLIQDPYLAYHSLNVARFSLQIGIAAGLSDNQLLTLACGGMCHDIGKIKIPKDILYKPGKLTGHEYELVKKHAEFGYKILKELGVPNEICEIARNHHERLDGSGYVGIMHPSELAQIVTVADIFSALTEQREYHKAYSTMEAIRIITQEKGVNRDYLRTLINHINEHATYIEQQAV